jgi:hypothetical protein
MDEVVLNIKFSEEIVDVLKQSYIFVVFFIVVLYMYAFIYAANVYITKQSQDKLVRYYNTEIN